MANDKVPYDAKVAIANAEVVDQMAKLPWAGFVAGTDKMPNGDQVRHDISELLDTGSGPTWHLLRHACYLARPLCPRDAWALLRRLSRS